MLLRGLQVHCPLSDRTTTNRCALTCPAGSPAIRSNMVRPNTLARGRRRWRRMMGGRPARRRWAPRAAAMRERGSGKGEVRRTDAGGVLQQIFLRRNKSEAGPQPTNQRMKPRGTRIPTGPRSRGPFRCSCRALARPCTSTNQNGSTPEMKTITVAAAANAHNVN